MKHLFALLAFLFHGFTPSLLNAQGIYVASGTTFEVATGTTFHVDGLTLINSAPFDFNGLTVTKNATRTNNAGASPPPAADRYYLFNTNTPSFSGTVQVNYEDVEVIGLVESSLQVNNYSGTGTVWNNYTSTTNDVTNNYVLSTTLSGVTLREIALASSSAPLPVTWLNFTATKQGDNVLLHWSTAQEKNSLDFVIQHSFDGGNFTDLNTQSAAGTSSAILHYNYVHNTPISGFNFYRILQRDFNGLSSYSVVRQINFSKEKMAPKVQIVENPIQGNDLQIVIQGEEDISIYNMVGQLFFEKHFDKGIHSIDMSHFEIGTYLLRTNTNTIKLLKL